MPEQQSIEQTLRDCLDPSNDGTFNRADALQRLINEQGIDLPIEDYDSGLITDVSIESYRGYGGPFIEHMTKIVECPECGYERAEYSFSDIHGFEYTETIECSHCQYIATEGSL